MIVDENKWLEILRQEADRTSITAAAKKIGYSRSSVSLALKGDYPGGIDRLRAAVLEKLTGAVPCPHLKTDLKSSECKDYRTRRMPLSDPKALRHWTACQTCPHFKAKQGDEAHV